MQVACCVGRLHENRHSPTSIIGSIMNHRKELAEIFRDGPQEKGTFLSRVFGIFSEEIVRIWARDDKSPYSLLDRRPTLYRKNRRYTLDFLLKNNGKIFVSEMKCEIQFRNYKYWRLIDTQQVQRHRKKEAFKLFLSLSRNPNSVIVKAGSRLDVAGTVLVWGAATPNGIEAVKRKFGISDVLTVESCIEDLVKWNNEEYSKFLQMREQWLSSLFSNLRGI